jgi:hypothetical protein
MEEEVIKYAKYVDAKVYRRRISNKDKIEMLNEQSRFFD